MENLLTDEAAEEARSRRAVTLFLRLLGTSLVLGGAVGLLLPLTWVLGGSRSVLPSSLGILSGISVAAGFASSRRSRTALATALGAVTLPGLAVYLGLMAASGPAALEAASSALSPFLAWAVAGIASWLCTAAIWRTRPAAGAEATEIAFPRGAPRARSAPTATVGTTKEVAT